MSALIVEMKYVLDTMISQERRETLGYNPNRTSDLFALTSDGYIIAQDIACQHEYVAAQRCPDSEQSLIPIAHINRSFQGLSEIVALCPTSGERFSFIFDISNDIYQAWWADLMGENYERQYDEPPRTADPNKRFFDE